MGLSDIADRQAVEITVRVYTERDGPPDRFQWKYSVAGGEFSCPFTGGGSGGSGG
jgi:hypothetical protein